MKSKEEQLQNRGFIKNGSEIEFEDVSIEKKNQLLKSKIATERTLGARLLKGNKSLETVDFLIKSLQQKKKLYPKIEICNSLIEMNELAVLPLIMNLGKIGTNQHKILPEKEFSKDTYPLPRDIASRTLIRIGKTAMPNLLLQLDTDNQSLLSELIDTIGHINFNYTSENIYKPLLTCYHKNENNDLIKWKIIRAFCGIKESEVFLNTLLSDVKNERINKEIERSLRLIIKYSVF